MFLPKTLQPVPDRPVLELFIKEIFRGLQCITNRNLRRRWTSRRLAIKIIDLVQVADQLSGVVLQNGQPFFEFVHVLANIALYILDVVDCVDGPRSSACFERSENNTPSYCDFLRFRCLLAVINRTEKPIYRSNKSCMIFIDFRIGVSTL